MSKKVFVGVDGCRGGWFAVFLAAEKGQHCAWETGIFPNFSSLIDFLRMNYGQAEPLILIDIPIGLKSGGYGERLSDIGARGILKTRSPAFSLCRIGKLFMPRIMRKPARSTRDSQEKVFPGRHGT